MKKEMFSNPMARLFATVSACAVALATAFGFSWLLGKDFKPAAPETIPTIGRIQQIRMPNGARSLAEIRRFSVNMPESGAHAKIFVNNYVLINNESPNKLFITLVGDKAARDAITELAANRHNYFVGSRPARYYLRKGYNYIVAELENIYIGCDTEIDIVVNGHELELFPKIVPDQLHVEAGAINAVVKKRLDSADDKIKYGGNDTLCARRIWEFYLE